MSEKDALLLVKFALWTAAFGMSWVYAARGHSTIPQFDLWTGGIMCVLFFAGFVVLCVGMVVKP